MALPTKPNPPVTALGHPTFTITLDSIRITDTRALHQDTDYVTCALQLKSATASAPAQTRRMKLGDVNNGTINIGLSFPGMQVDPSQTLIFNYLVFNAGYPLHQPSYLGEREVESLLETASLALADKGLVGGGTKLSPDYITALPGIGCLLPDPGGA